MIKPPREVSNSWEDPGAARRTGARRRGIRTLALCGLLAASGAAAQNLLPNAGFNTGIGGWSTSDPDISLSWSNLDAKGSSGSGSLQMTNAKPIDDNIFDTFGICIAVTAGQKYHQGASFYFPGGQAQSSILVLLAQFYSSDDCSSGFISIVPSRTLFPTPNTWQRLDTQPFVAPAGATGMRATIGFLKRGNGGAIVCNLDDVVFELAGENLCFSSDDLLCVGSRFRVTAQWASGSSSGGVGHATQLASDTGSFWFFTPNNLEILVKVLDACSFNSNKWVFAGGLTNVEVTLEVTDLQTGSTKTYTNPLNVAFQPIQDTSAFSTCP